MLSSRPMIEKLSELLVSGNRSVVVDVGTGPRGMKNYDLGGVGLGIVAALEKSSEDGRDILGKYRLYRSSSPRPVSSCPRKHPAGFSDEVEDFDSSENYTYVTCHEPNKTVTKVYYDGGYHDGAIHLQVMDGSIRKNAMDISKNSQEAFFEHADYPTSEFLSYCHLCRKNLHGQDIYMYRGEIAFCSPECRSSHMMMDERREQCRSEASRSVDVSSSPYTSGQIFSTGILAA